MTMNTNPDISLDDVLEELALTSAKPDARVLGEPCPGENCQPL